jgi:hypothetical protein
MHRKTIMTVVWAFAMVIAMASFALAYVPSHSQQAATQSLRTAAISQGQQERFGAQQQEQPKFEMYVQIPDKRSIFGTVERVDKAAGTIKLQSEKQETVELRVPDWALSELQAGDRVEVAIRERHDQKPSIMSGV